MQLLNTCGWCDKAKSEQMEMHTYNLWMKMPRCKECLKKTETYKKGYISDDEQEAMYISNDIQKSYTLRLNKGAKNNGK